MLINLFVSFLSLSVLALICATKGGGSKSNWLVLFPFVAIFVYFFYSATPLVEEVVAWQWVKYNNYSVDFIVKSSKEVFFLFMPFLVISLLLVFDVLQNKQEERKLNFFASVFLNLAALLLLFSASNMFQLMIASCFVTIVAFYVIPELEEKKYFIYTLLISEMLIYSAFAIVFAQMGNIEFINFPAYSKYGVNLNIVACFLIFASIIKMGLFGVHSIFIKLSETSFSKLYFVLFLSTPIVGITLLYKTNALWLESNIAKNILLWIVYLSSFWGVFRILFSDSIKERAVYLNMLLFSALSMLVIYDSQAFYQQLYIVMLSVFIANNVLYIANVSASNEMYISKMGGFYKSVKLSFYLSILLCFPLVYLFWSYIGNLHIALIFGAMLVAMSQNIYQIYLSENHTDEKVFAFLKNAPALICIPLCAIAVMLLPINLLNQWQVYALLLGFIALILVAPFRWTQRYSHSYTFQEFDGFVDVFYVLLLLPIKVIGRVLWLSIDFSLIDKKILNSISKFFTILVINVNRIQNKLWLNYAVFTAIGVLAIVLLVRNYK